MKAPKGNLDALQINVSANLIDALAAVDKNGRGFVLVVDETRKLVGTVTDGDIRRALLRSLRASSPIHEIMNANPRWVRAGDIAAVNKTLSIPGILFVPVLDEAGRITDVVYREVPKGTFGVRDNIVVIMAGGRGMRLGPLTQDKPKPLVPVAGKPMIERVVEDWRDRGFRHFIVTLNYKGDMIREFLGDGRSRGVMIDYVEEKEPLGTAGSLSLLPEKPGTHTMVVNCDVVTGLDFGDMLDQHVSDRAAATMAVRDYVTEVPFGIVHTHSGCIVQISEKPRFTYQVAAGIYALSPESFDAIERGKNLDMPTLFERLIAGGSQTRCYHVNEFWFDLGTQAQIDDASAYIQGRERD